MANEITIQSALRIAVASGLQYQSLPQQVVASFETAAPFGPTPGAVLVTDEGVAVDLSALTVPGVARIFNSSTEHYVTLGVYDGTEFTPVLDVLPGESYAVRLSQFLGQQYAGTGTVAGGSSQLFLVCQAGGDAVVVFEAFEK